MSLYAKLLELKVEKAFLLDALEGQEIDESNTEQKLQLQQLGTLEVIISFTHKEWLRQSVNTLDN